MLTTNKRNVADLIEICSLKGMKQVVICPGSRNAPLIIGFDAKDEIEVHHVVDERSAGFYALGLSLQSGEPVGIVCSSGSAVLNFAPAIVEAFHQGVPLIVMTADRPKELIGQMAGQTMNQLNVYANYIKKSVELQLNDASEKIIAYNQRNCNEALNCALSNKKGPVHINIPLDEPLYDQEEYISEVKLINAFNVTSVLEQSEWDRLSGIWSDSRKILVLVGQHAPNPSLEQRLIELAKDMRVVVLTENLANVKLRDGLHCIDRSLLSMDPNMITEFVPDLLVTFGGAVVSKKIKSFLTSHEIKNHWNITEGLELIDTYEKLTHQFTSDSHTFLKKMVDSFEFKNNYNYRSTWKKDDFANRDNQSKYMESVPFSDLKTFYLINELLPENCNLHLSNSSVVRYSQLFDPIPNVNYFGNRGVSGIDGSTSTVFGYAKNSNRMNVFITGDLSFLYDSNAFWIDSIESNLKIILINNGGGGIFKIIPGPNTTKSLKEGFSTEHNHSFRKLVEAHDVDYSVVDNEDDIEEKLTYLLYKSKGVSVLEVDTSKVLNESYLHDYFNELKK